MRIPGLEWFLSPSRRDHVHSSLKTWLTMSGSSTKDVAKELKQLVMRPPELLFHGSGASKANPHRTCIWWHHVRLSGHFGGWALGLGASGDRDAAWSKAGRGGAGGQPGLPGPRKTSLPDPKGVANSPAAAVLRTCGTLRIRKEAASLLEHVFPSRRTPVPGAGLSQVRACADHQGEKGFPFWVYAIEDGEPTRCFFLLSFWDYTWPSVKTHRCCGLPRR